MATTINAGRVRFVSRGTYNNSTQYYLFDLVDYNGSSYIAKENTVGNLPTNTQYWQLIAEKGNTGNTGATGPVGATGNGIASITKTSTSGLVDTYTITYTNGNTTTFTITNGEDGEVTETELNVLRQKVANQQKVIDQLPQATGQGTSITLENTIEAQFTKFDVEGNSTQDGTPSPDNEVPIYSAGDNENLFDITTAINGYFETDTNGEVSANKNWKLSQYIEVKNNSSYTMSRSDGTRQSFVIAEYDENKTFIKRNEQGFQPVGVNLPYTITTGATTKYIRINYNNTFQATTIKLEKGNKASGYSPYGMGSINEKIKNADGTEEQDYSIFVQQPFRSIGDVRDCFVKKVDGKWYEKHIIGEIVFDGSKDEFWNYEELSYGNNFYINISNAKGGNEIPVLSNCFKYYEYGRLNPNYSCKISATKNLNLRHQDFTNVNDFKTWLSTHNVVVQYELEEPLDLPCTEEQIQQLENLPSTYKDFTIIQSEDETGAYLEVSGIYDLNNLINN